MASFLEVIEDLPEGFLGAPAESGFSGGALGQAEGDLNPGVVVMRDATTKEVRPPETAAEVLLCQGVVLYDPLHIPASDTYLYGADDVVPVMRKGFIWANNEEAMTIHDPVYVRHTAKGGNTVLGAIRDDADAGDATDAVLRLTETDANVEDGTFVVVLEDTEDGAVYTAEFTSSTDTHADAAAGIAAAIDAVAPTTSTPGVEAADAIDIAIVHADSGNAVRILHVESVGASALSVQTQGASGATCTLHPDLRVDRDTSSTGLCRLAVDFK